MLPYDQLNSTTSILEIQAFRRILLYIILGNLEINNNYLRAMNVFVF